MLDDRFVGKASFTIVIDHAMRLSMELFNKLVSTGVASKVEAISDKFTLECDKLTYDEYREYLQLFVEQVGQKNVRSTYYV